MEKEIAKAAYDAGFAAGKAAAVKSIHDNADVEKLERKLRDIDILKTLLRRAKERCNNYEISITGEVLERARDDATGFRSAV